LRLLPVLALLAALAAHAQERSYTLASGETVSYRLVDEAGDSARPTAQQLLKLLAAGEIDAAAELSNAPPRRREVLRDYQATVGEAEFRRVFGEYAERRVVAEFAIGERRLIVWDLGDASHHLAGQYFVRAGERFVLDDVPGEERQRLQRLLAAYRAGRLRP
jgi:hypothetical protein